MSKQKRTYKYRKDCNILFADIKGFGGLKEFQQKLYLKEVLPRIADALYKGDYEHPDQTNTWGDGLVAFFSSQADAIQCALTLRDIFRNTQWEDMGLPPLKIRIALHAGEVFVGYNPIRKKEEIIGTEVNRAARLEPVVPPNQVYATSDFSKRYKKRNFRFYSVGKSILPKGWGEEEIYVVCREHEIFVPNNIKEIIGGFYNQLSILFPPSSAFGSRLSVSQAAKNNIAEYCAKSTFWNLEDIVFIESGTLPVFMIFALYRYCNPEKWPKFLFTNNLACSMLTMMVELSKNETSKIYPKDKPANLIITGGLILPDYAAAIPEDLFPKNVKGIHKGSFWQSNKIVEYFSQKGVNHVVMMVSRLTGNDGPCAVSLAMRRFKKLLLQYVYKNGKTRLSILCEAEKLIERPGSPADTVDLPGSKITRYWGKLLNSKRVTVISAISPDMTDAKIGLIKREINTLSKYGASCTLLGIDGDVIELNEG